METHNIKLENPSLEKWSPPVKNPFKISEFNLGKTLLPPLEKGRNYSTAKKEKSGTALVATGWFHLLVFAARLVKKMVEGRWKTHL